MSGQASANDMLLKFSTEIATLKGKAASFCPTYEKQFHGSKNRTNCYNTLENCIKYRGDGRTLKL